MVCMAENEERTQFKLMLPVEVKAHLEEAAHEKRRSLSAEIIARLDFSITNPPEVVQELKRKLEAIDDELNVMEGDLKEQAQALANQHAATSELKQEFAARERRLQEQELYWMNIAMANNSLRRTQLLQFKAAMAHIASFGEKMPKSVSTYCDALLGLYNDQIDQLPEDQETIDFLVSQAKRADELVYFDANAEDDPDFIIEPPREGDDTAKPPKPE